MRTTVRVNTTYCQLSTCEVGMVFVVVDGNRLDRGPRAAISWCCLPVWCWRGRCCCWRTCCWRCSLARRRRFPIFSRVVV